METINGIDLVLFVWAVVATVLALSYRSVARSPRNDDTPLDDLLGPKQHIVHVEVYDWKKEGL